MYSLLTCMDAMGEHRPASRISHPENLPPFENKLMADVTFSRNVLEHSELMLLLPEDPKRNKNESIVTPK
jgi:hypothetical protein